MVCLMAFSVPQIMYWRWSCIHGWSTEFSKSDMSVTRGGDGLNDESASAMGALMCGVQHTTMSQCCLLK